MTGGVGMSEMNPLHGALILTRWCGLLKWPVRLPTMFSEQDCVEMKTRALLFTATLLILVAGGCKLPDEAEEQAKRDQMSKDCSKLAAAYAMRPGGVGVSDGGASALKVAQDCMKSHGY